MRTTTLQSSKASSRLWKLFAAMLLVWILVPIGQASAQEKSSTNNGSRSTLTGVDDLPGIDPSETYCTSNGTNETDVNKIVYLYNVGAKKFLSIGGMWGTHASLDATPNPIYMKWDNSMQAYLLENKVKGSTKQGYLGIDTKHKEVFMDLTDNERSAVRFEKAKEYSETNKVYLVRIGNNTTLGYLTAYPDNISMLCNHEGKATEDDQTYKNQEWKVITKAEYYQLFNIAPANMKAAVDASFLIACPDFRVNDADATKWKIAGDKLPTDVNGHVRFGDAHMYKRYDKLEATGSGAWTGYTNQEHQRLYGQYFYCYTEGLRGYTFYQDVQVHKAGWYLLRCNGFSSANSSESITENGKPLANLFVTVLDANLEPIETKYSTASLDGISQSDAALLAKEKEGAGIGYAFLQGKFENQVQICLDDETISSDKPAILRIGFYVEATPEGKPKVDPKELTAVDNFRLLYAGPRRNPELVLDEESIDLRYLTEAKDEYKNSVLHLNRKLNDNMWNSLILPVDLTWGQMKRSFGDGVKVAKLAALTEKSVQFVTVEPKNDDDLMVKAFEPYIVYPPYTVTRSPEYTVEHFYTTEGEDNSSWLGTDYQPSSDEKNCLKKTVPADHYEITMVSLNREALKENVNLETWEAKTTFSGSGIPGTMVCKGTMAKTYDNGEIIEGRNDLNGAFFMYKGKLIQVPSGNKEDGEKERYQYGLKAFRCWFELTGNTTSGNSLSLMIDGVEDSATSIDDIHTDADHTSYKRGVEGVFNMNGQMVRRDNSLEGLPKGMYVVNGKKVIIK